MKKKGFLNPHSWTNGTDTGSMKLPNLKQQQRLGPIEYWGYRLMR